jgi:hypothetical protein
VPQTILTAVSVILLMLMLSWTRTNWDRVSATLGEWGWTWFGAKPDRVPGD